MSASIEVVLGQNITIVYDSLDLLRVERDHLRAVRHGGEAPSLIDNPDVLLAVFPPEPVVVQIGDNRLRITVQGNKTAVGDLPIWDIAHRCTGLLDPGRSRLVAYGFNYDVGVRITDMTYMHWVTTSLMRDADALASLVGGSIQIIAPRIKFRHESVDYDMILDPVHDDRIQIHLNTHFEKPGIALPGPDALRVQYMDAYNFFHEVVTSMFRGAKQ